jgi:hypothetical protein
MKLVSAAPASFLSDASYLQVAWAPVAISESAAANTITLMSPSSIIGAAPETRPPAIEATARAGRRKDSWIIVAAPLSGFWPPSQLVWDAPGPTLLRLANGGRSNDFRVFPRI